MSKVFQVIPKRIKRVNGTVLTPEMVVTVTTQMHNCNSVLQRCERSAGSLYAAVQLRLQKGVLFGERLRV